jgi:hypothetical protein
MEIPMQRSLRRTVALAAIALAGFGAAALWATTGRSAGASSSPPLALPASFDVWTVQAKDQSRGSIVPSPGRIGQSALRLQVLPGDTDVAGSGPGAERADAMVSASLTDAVEGRSQWWAWSTYFPADFNPTPQTAWNGFLDFHNTGDTGLANIGFQVDTHYADPRLEMTVYGGSQAAAPSTFVIGRIRRLQWYDFTLHVVWSSDPALGLIQLFLDGKSIAGPARRATLWPGQDAYLKLANYREAGPAPSAILTAGVLRTTSYAAALRSFAPYAKWARIALKQLRR